MIPNTLKVGDTFSDGNRTFEVLSVEGNGVYISKCIKTIPIDALTSIDVKVEEPKEETQLDSFNKYTKTEINRLNVAELEKVCDKLGLEKSTGMAMKKAIIEKLGL
jgi:hypothetical protein